MKKCSKYLQINNIRRFTNSNEIRVQKCFPTDICQKDQTNNYYCILYLDLKTSGLTCYYVKRLNMKTKFT
jgi:hypothetical protein